MSYIATISIPEEYLLRLEELVSSSGNAVSSQDSERLLWQSIKKFDDGVEAHINLVQNMTGETRVDAFLYKFREKVDYNLSFRTFWQNWVFDYRGTKYIVVIEMTTKLGDIQLNVMHDTTWDGITQKILVSNSTVYKADAHHHVYAVSEDAADQLAFFFNQVMDTRDKVRAEQAEVEFVSEAGEDTPGEYVGWWRVAACPLLQMDDDA
jgi:hypothetical protein